MKKLLLIIALMIFALALTGCGCKHSEQHLVNAKAVTCTTDGYTGDSVCDKCDKVVTTGEVIPATGHVEGEVVRAVEPNCEHFGYTGDTLCSVCGEVAVRGEELPMTDHVPSTERFNAWSADCVNDGYTGDVYCSVCQKYLEGGRPIPATGHTLGEPTDVIEVSCLADGYTGDRRCTICDRLVKGETIAKYDHQFDENHTCTVCQWKEPGLYVNGKLEFDWNQMLENKYVIVKDGESLTQINTSLYGQLVVAEGLTITKEEVFRGSALNSIYLPASVNRIKAKTFADCAALEEVRCFGEVRSIDDYAFFACTALKHFDVPEGVEDIRHGAFQDCTALETITLPEGLDSIYKYAFRGCTALREITLPESVTSIGEYAFLDCENLKSLVLPENFRTLSEGALEGSGVTELVLNAALNHCGDCINSQLVSFDLSQFQATSIKRGFFGNMASLETLVLPATLTDLRVGAFDGCVSLKRLDLPDGLMNLSKDSHNLGDCTSLTTVVWPVSLADGSVLANTPNLKNILYRGSELQWDMTASKDMFENYTIVFDYEPQA